MGMQHISIRLKQKSHPPNTQGHQDRCERLQTSEQLAASTSIRVFAKIGMMLDTAALEVRMKSIQSADNVRIIECIDSCIYLHDRGDYKSGWQLEDEWEKDQKKRAQRALQGLPESSDDEVEDDVPQIEVPKTCPICEKKFKHPIQTRCEHFFCESCALNHYSKNKTCFTCKKPLNGIFNDATKSLLKLKEEAEAAEALRNKNGGKNKKREDRVLGTDLGNGAPGRGQDGESDEDRGEIEDETFKDVVFEGEEAERMINNLNNGRSSMDAIVRDKEELRRTYEAEEREEDDDEVNMEKLAKEFKKKSLKQKGFQRTESDWLLQNLNVCVNVYTKFLFGLIKQTSL
eukprot:TRINITY_DN5128_c0_g1_i3.p1 TRINITY_DN5128_c0_g1~~TRINITY_DN5128_c0_g1_i3.p1  ORF type:complete len:345 (+),score=55.93 TRINITY_DN5128_c0_g1_i3:372-1406(+)